MATKRVLTAGAAALLTAAALAAYGGASYAAAGAAPSKSAAASAPGKSAAATVVKCSAGTPTVTVAGNGTSTATPNEVMIALAVQTQAATAAAAMTSNSSKTSALVAKLLADGVAKADLQTSNISVQPNYNNSGTVIISYQVTNSLALTLHDTSRAGTIIDDAAAIAGNAIRVQGITFSVQDQSAMLAQARAAAVHQAAGQAQAMATAAGLTLGPLCSLQDNSSVVPPQPLNAAGPTSAVAGSTPVEPGSLQVTANVTAVYELSS
jgi:uncharacterized protein YggE